MTSPERETYLRWLAMCVHVHLPRVDALLVARIASEQPDRFAMYLAAGPRDWTPETFAWYALNIAKRIDASPIN